MKRVNLDQAQPAVKRFVRDLQIGAEGVELEMDGKVVCEVVPPHTISAAERAALLLRGRELARQARARNTGVPARVIAREVRQAVDEVRGRKRR